jgi:hypothetical protein
MVVPIAVLARLGDECPELQELLGDQEKITQLTDAIAESAVAMYEYSVQFRHVVTHSNVLVLEQEEEEPVSLFRVFVDLGVRWLEPGQEETEDEVEPKAYVRGVMVAEYRMTEDPGQGALKQFALRNASYHVWPYWREYLMGQCLRMNLPKLVLPAVQFAQNRASE